MPSVLLSWRQHARVDVENLIGVAYQPCRNEGTKETQKNIETFGHQGKNQGGSVATNR